MNMPRFTAEASIYRTRNYRKAQVDGVSDAFAVVLAFIACYDWGCAFTTPYCFCECEWGGHCSCRCHSEPLP
jgi:hypothetical protein